jgi:hypothetical protein
MMIAVYAGRNVAVAEALTYQDIYIFRAVSAEDAV